MSLCPAHARTVLDLDTNRQPVPLLDWGDAWIDDSGATRIDQLVKRADIPWEPTHIDHRYALGPGKALWIRIRVPPAPDWERWYIEVPYPSVDSATLYELDNFGVWHQLVAGDTTPTITWPLPHRYPVLPINVSAADPVLYFLKIENTTGFSAPLQFVSESQLNSSEQRSSILLGMFFGLAALTVMLSIANAIAFRSKAYGLFALSVALMTLVQASLTGIASLHLWPTNAWWSNAAPTVLPPLAVGAYLGFYDAMVALRDRNPGLHRVLMVIVLAALPVAAALLIMEPAWRYRVMLFYVCGAIVAGVAIIGWVLRRGYPYGYWLLISTIPLLVGVCLVLARINGLLAASFWTLYAMLIAIALQVPILLNILTRRNLVQREHQSRVQGFSRIDPATGVLHANVFHERLARLIARSSHLKIRSAVLLVDIVNVGQIRRNFGVEAAIELPLRVAGRLLRTARDIDSVARLSNNRFGLLLEGPLKADEVAEAAPRVVARCLMPFKGRPLEWTARVHVAQALVPMDGTDPKLLMDQLAALLAAVPPDSKRAVFLLSPAQHTQAFKSPPPTS